MLDDMAMQLTQEKSDHKEALSDLKLQHEKEVRRTRTPQSCCWLINTLTSTFSFYVLYFSSLCVSIMNLYLNVLFQKGFKNLYENRTSASE